MDSFFLGRSGVSHQIINDYVNADYLVPDSLGNIIFRPPGDETIPEPRPNEAIVFRDQFVAGLRFPLDPFVSGVLERFDMQLHQVTPNGISRLSSYAMAMKMYGLAPSVDVFARYYSIKQRRNKIKNPVTGTKTYSDFGAYTFVPKKVVGKVPLVPTFKNKWPQWTKWWFYHVVCSGCDVESARANNEEKAVPLVSVLTPIRALKSPAYSLSSRNALDCESALADTSVRQIGRDLVEEAVALKKHPLSEYTKFTDIVVQDGYKAPKVTRGRPKRFATDSAYVSHVERKADKICGSYIKTEHFQKLQSVGTKRRLNRVFDQMGVVYPDRIWPPLGDATAVGENQGKGKGKVPASAADPGQGPSRLSRQPKTKTVLKQKKKAVAMDVCPPEPKDVTDGRLLAKAVGQSRKVSLASDPRPDEMLSISGVSFGFRISPRQGAFISFCRLVCFAGSFPGFTYVLHSFRIRRIWRWPRSPANTFRQWPMTRLMRTFR
jgi:hypothetical protein